MNINIHKNSKKPLEAAENRSEKTLKMVFGWKRRFKNFKVGDEQAYVEAYPKTGKHERSKFDILILVVHELDEKTGKRGEKKEIDMTPDEALQIAGMLMTAANFWLMNYKPYWDTTMKWKKKMAKKHKKSE